MHIVADENIPHVREAFSCLGEVTTRPGRSMTAEMVRDADLLLVRSVTRVDESMLAGSRVAYVGTATSGIDHIDVQYLTSNKIGFGHAQGANANSVAEYVLAALLEAVSLRDTQLNKIACGIVGYGRIGSAVYAKLRVLGIQCRVFDPPLAQESTDDFFCTWDAIVECDIITFHVPLTTDGPCPTRRMVDDDFLRNIRPDVILINTARGEVMDTDALVRAKTARPDLFYVIDVWENEPDIDLGLLKLADIATPHIAGYSWDAKMAGTRQIFEGACRHFNRPCQWSPPSDPPSPAPLDIRVGCDNIDEIESLRAIIRHAYPILEDDKCLRTQMAENGGSHGAAFDRLRKNYWTRREFGAFRVDTRMIGADLSARCELLGFKIPKGVSG